MKRAIELINRIEEIAQDGETVGTCETLREILTKQATAHENTASRLKSLSKGYNRATDRHEERAKELYKLRGVNNSLKIENDVLTEENNTLLSDYKKLLAFADKLINGLKDKELREKAADELSSVLMPF